MTLICSNLRALLGRPGLAELVRQEAGLSRGSNLVIECVLRALPAALAPAGRRREADAALRARVLAVADWLAEQEAAQHNFSTSYEEGARDAYDLAEQRLRTALD